MFHSSHVPGFSGAWDNIISLLRNITHYYYNKFFPVVD